MHFGFSYVGLIFLTLLMVPNLIWTKNQPKDYKIYAANENKILLAFERVGEVLVSCLVLIFSDFTDMLQTQDIESGIINFGSKPSFFKIWRSRFLAFLRFQLLALRSNFIHLAISKTSCMEIVLSSSILTAEIIF